MSQGGGDKPIMVPGVNRVIHVPSNTTRTVQVPPIERTIQGPTRE